MTTSVIVHMMEFKWLTRKGKNFLNLVEILNKTQTKAIVKTNFVKFVLNGFWETYFKKIFLSQFIPSLFYQMSMLSYLTYTLQSDQDSVEYQIIYYPLLGFTLAFKMNLVMTEIRQWQHSDSNWEYLLSIWNLNDLVYLILNFVVIIAHHFSLGNLHNIRIVAAISSCFLWLKILDWLRLFDKTAFFIFLIRGTVNGIWYFLIIMLVWYMMFGTAFYLLNLSRSDQYALVP